MRKFGIGKDDMLVRVVSSVFSVPSIDRRELIEKHGFEISSLSSFLTERETITKPALSSRSGLE